MSKTRWFVFTMLQPILCRIFYHPNTETALLVACGHMESLTETKSCSLAWRILTNNIRDPLPSEQVERRCMSICNAEQAACRTYGVPLLGAALDSKGGYHQWRHQSLITKKSSHWHSPVYLATAFPFCLSLSFFFFFSIFLILESPSSPVTCFAICSCRWCHPEKSESLLSPNPSWFSWFSLSQSSRENKWETGKHISKH